MDTSRIGIMVVFVVIYLAALILIGLITKKWVKESSGYLVAGRGIGTLTMGVALVSIIAAGTTFSGATGLGFTVGMPGAIWSFSWAFSALLCAMFFARLSRATGCYSIAEWIGVRFGDRARYVLTIPQAIASILSGAAQIVGSAFIITGICGCSYMTAVIVSSIIVLVYSYMGGLWAVTMTEFLQVILLCFAVVLSVGWLMATYGGWSTLTGSLPAHFFHYPGKLGWGVFNGKWGLLTQIGLAVGFFLIVVPNTYIWTKTAATRSMKSAQRGFWVAAILAYVFVTWLIAMIGMYGKAIGLEPASPNAIYGLLVNKMPAILAALVFTGILSAIMSTASGAIMGAGVTITRDLYQPFAKNATDAQVTRMSQIIVVLCWIIVFVLSLVFKAIGPLLALGLCFAYFAITLPPFLASFYFPSVKEPEVFWAVIVSFVVTTWYVLSKQWLQPPHFFHPIWVGVAISFIVLVVVNFIRRAVSSGSEKSRRTIEVTDRDTEVLALIAQGRNLPIYLIDELGVTAREVNESIERLLAASYVTRRGTRAMGYLTVDVTDAGRTYLASKGYTVQDKVGVLSDIDRTIIAAVRDMSAKKFDITTLAERVNLDERVLSNKLLYLLDKELVSTPELFRISTFEVTRRGLKAIEV